MTHEEDPREGGSVPTREELARIREEAMDLANVGIYRYRLDGTLVFMDRGALRLLDIEKEIEDPSELYGQKLADLMQYIDSPGSLRRLTLEQGFVKNLEYHYRTLKGEERWVQHTAYMVKNQKTGEPEIQVLSRDITDLKRTALALQASEGRLRTLIEDSPLGILVLAGEPPRPVMANRTLLLLLGRPEGSVFAPDQEDPVQWFHPEDRPRMEACLKRRDLAGSQGEACALRLSGAHAGPVWVELQVSEIVFDQSPALQVIFMDVTARLEAERQHRELEARVQEAQRLESLGVLAGGVAHDFNNLLAAIMGNTEFLREWAAGNPELACAVDEVASATERAAELCRQLLAYSGRRTLSRQPLDLTRLVEDSSGLIGITVPRKVELVLDLAPGLPAVAADASQLRQVVVNLAVNAAESLVDGAGGVRIRTGFATLDRAGVRRLVHGDQISPGSFVYLEVEDDGCGMTEEVQGRLFEPFYSTKFTGRGLGLAAVRGIVRGHGGAFEIESAPGRGSRIRMYLPALTAPAGPETAPAPEPDDWRGEGVVLLADDEPAPRGITARLLAAIGFEPVLAGGGPEAVRRFEEDPGRFKLAVLDVVMPGLDGPGVFHRLRELAPRLPVLFISGYDDDGLQGELADPATDFLQKPFKLTELRSRMRRLAAFRH